jgi:hypothetical protein
MRVLSALAEFASVLLKLTKHGVNPVLLSDDVIIHRKFMRIT